MLRPTSWDEWGGEQNWAKSGTHTLVLHVYEGGGVDPHGGVQNPLEEIHQL